MKEYDYSTNPYHEVCSPIAAYCRAQKYLIPSLFVEEEILTTSDDIRVVELFAGVGGFRIGLERASDRFKTVWSNQWEPSTKRQDASIIYVKQFGIEGHSNQDINLVETKDIPSCDLLVGGFPCQDYSVATTLNRSGGLQGKKGVLWWQIHRIISESKTKPKFLFFENVDRLLKSPATQRGRDFAIILASLSDLGYDVEWRVINAADYGMPQRRRRTYIVGFLQGTFDVKNCQVEDWLLNDGIFAKVFGVESESSLKSFKIDGTLGHITQKFNTKQKHSFENTGFMSGRRVYTMKTKAKYDGPFLSLGDILVDEKFVPEEFFISGDDLPKWEYQKGSKSFLRKNSEGFEYTYSEGGMAFPDPLDKPSRTIITGEGGKSASRFKHVVKTPSGRFRRLLPIELERLNMFPDNHTLGSSDMRRAFLMGNALVTGIVEKIGYSILSTW